MTLRSMASVSAISFAVLGAPAFAQQTSTADEVSQESPNDEARQDTIIVTSTRREQSLQDVPLAVTAFQQEAMSEKGIVSYDGLARETPTVRR